MGIVRNAYAKISIFITVLVDVQVCLIIVKAEVYDIATYYHT